MQQAFCHWDCTAELRIVHETKLTDGSGAYSDSFPFMYQWLKPYDIVTETPNSKKWQWDNPDTFAGLAVRVDGTEYLVRNEFAHLGIASPYRSEVAGHLRDFTALVRTGEPDEFTADMAVMSWKMDLAAKLSAKRNGALTAINDPEIEQIDAEDSAAYRKQYGFDPMDIEAALG